MAEDLNKQLDDLSRNLSQMIDEVNRLSNPAQAPPPSQLTASTFGASGPPSASVADAASQMPDDPVNQLSAILGAHLRALSNIDGNASKLENRVDDLEKRMVGQSRGGYGARR
jgi:nuclear pore complex protein Nup62